MNTEIFELSDEEIMAISGGSRIDPPVAIQALTDDYPQIDNNPPG